MMWCLLAVVLAVAASAEGRDGKLYTSEADCSEDCRGSRVLSEGQCSERLGEQSAARFQCRCQSGYYDVSALADDECGDVYWSLFTYGTWVHDEKSEEACSITCGSRFRVWTTVFTIITFAAAVTILLFILPLCISSCTACLTAKKERKTRKKVDQIAYSMRA